MCVFLGKKYSWRIRELLTDILLHSHTQHALAPLSFQILTIFRRPLFPKPLLASKLLIWARQRRNLFFCNAIELEYARAITTFLEFLFWGGISNSIRRTQSIRFSILSNPYQSDFVISSLFLGRGDFYGVVAMRRVQGFEESDTRRVMMRHKTAAFGGERLRSNGLVSRSRMRLWMIRATTTVLLWTCVVQLTALSETWGPRVLKAWPCFLHKPEPAFGLHSSPRLPLPPKSEPLLLPYLHLCVLIDWIDCCLVIDGMVDLQLLCYALIHFDDLLQLLIWLLCDALQLAVQN